MKISIQGHMSAVLDIAVYLLAISNALKRINCSLPDSPGDILYRHYIKFRNEFEINATFDSDLFQNLDEHAKSIQLYVPQLTASEIQTIVTQ